MAKPRACDCCSRRKVRCDRSFPCQNCLKAELCCSYAQQPKKRGPKGRTKVIQALKLLQMQNGVGNLSAEEGGPQFSGGYTGQQQQQQQQHHHQQQGTGERRTSTMSAASQSTGWGNDGEGQTYNPGMGTRMSRFEFGVLGGSARNSPSSISSAHGSSPLSTGSVSEGFFPPPTYPPSTTSMTSGNSPTTTSSNPHKRPRRQQGSTYFPCPHTGVLTLPNPTFRPDTRLLSKPFALACANIYFEKLYPVMPIFHRPTFSERYIDRFHDDPKLYALVASMCAITIIQLCAIPDPSGDISSTGESPAGSWNSTSQSQNNASKDPKKEWSTSDSRLLLLASYNQIYTSLSPGESTSGPSTLQHLSQALLLEALRARKYFDFVAAPDLDTVITSFFLFCAYGNLERARHAWYYLREACGFILEGGGDDERTYGREAGEASGNTKRKMEGHAGKRKQEGLQDRLRRKMFWLLFITERAYAIQRHHPLTLRRTIGLPSLPSLTPGEKNVEDEEDPHTERLILTNFITLANLFRTFDDTFVGLWNTLELRRHTLEPAPPIGGNAEKEVAISETEEVGVKSEAQAGEKSEDEAEENYDEDMDLDGEAMSSPPYLNFSKSWVETLHSNLDRVTRKTPVPSTDPDRDLLAIEGGAGDEGDLPDTNVEQENSNTSEFRAPFSTEASGQARQWEENAHSQEYAAQQAQLYYQSMKQLPRKFNPESRNSSIVSFTSTTSIPQPPPSTAHIPMATPTRTRLTQLIPIQRADILISRQWLHLIIWQLSISKSLGLRTNQTSTSYTTKNSSSGIVDSATQDLTQEILLPIAIAKGALEITARVTTETLEVHGIGMQEKLYDIGCALAAVISSSTTSPPKSGSTSTGHSTRSTSPQAQFETTLIQRSRAMAGQGGSASIDRQAESFETTPNNVLQEILRVLSKLRGGKSIYFEQLLEKVDGVLRLSSPGANGRGIMINLDLSLPKKAQGRIKRIGNRRKGSKESIKEGRGRKGETSMKVDMDISMEEIQDFISVPAQRDEVSLSSSSRFQDLDDEYKDTLRVGALVTGTGRDANIYSQPPSVPQQNVASSFTTESTMNSPDSMTYDTGNMNNMIPDFDITTLTTSYNTPSLYNTSHDVDMNSHYDPSSRAQTTRTSFSSAAGSRRASELSLSELHQQEQELEQQQNIIFADATLATGMQFSNHENYHHNPMHTPNFQISYARSNESKDLEQDDLSWLLRSPQPQNSNSNPQAQTQPLRAHIHSGYPFACVCPYPDLDHTPNMSNLNHLPTHAHHAPFSQHQTPQVPISYLYSSGMLPQALQSLPHHGHMGHTSSGSSVSSKMRGTSSNSGSGMQTMEDIPFHNPGGDGGVGRMDVSMGMGLDLEMNTYIGMGVRGTEEHAMSREGDGVGYLATTSGA